jgi:hypothetical protein
MPIVSDEDLIRRSEALLKKYPWLQAAIDAHKRAVVALMDERRQARARGETIKPLRDDLLERASLHAQSTLSF